MNLYQLPDEPNFIEREIEALQEWLLAVLSDVVKATEIVWNRISTPENRTTKSANGHCKSTRSQMT